MEAILSSIVWRLLRWLPPFILSRIFSSDWLAKNIYIDIRPRHTSVEVWLPDNPHVGVYLEVKNNTHFDIELDRLIINFIYGIEMAQLNHFKREKFKPGEEKCLYVKGNIEHNQYLLLPFHHERNSRNCKLEILAEFNSRFHNFSVEKNLEGVKPEIHNAQVLQTANNTLNSEATKNVAPVS